MESKEATVNISEGARKAIWKAAVTKYNPCGLSLFFLCCPFLGVPFLRKLTRLHRLLLTHIAVPQRLLSRSKGLGGLHLEETFITETHILRGGIRDPQYDGKANHPAWLRLANTEPCLDTCFKQDCRRRYLKTEITVRKHVTKSELTEV